MPGLVYILCAITSLVSAVLLLRGALARGGSGLLFWSSLCFFAMALNNVLLYANVVLPDIDLSIPGRVCTVVGIVLLNIGLIWHST